MYFEKVVSDRAIALSKDVGEIYMVQIKQIGDATTVDDKWTPAWLKVHLGQPAGAEAVSFK